MAAFKFKISSQRNGNSCIKSQQTPRIDTSSGYGNPLTGDANKAGSKYLRN